MENTYLAQGELRINVSTKLRGMSKEEAWEKVAFKLSELGMNLFDVTFLDNKGEQQTLDVDDFEISWNMVEKEEDCY